MLEGYVRQYYLRNQNGSNFYGTLFTETQKYTYTAMKDKSISHDANIDKKSNVPKTSCK